jgi:methionine aminotransferase
MAIYSFGKTYHVTGWKIGYCIAPEYLMKEFRKVHQFLVFSVNTPLQYAIADYLLQSNDYLQLSSFYQEKRDYFLSMIKNSRFDILPSSGTYFQLLSYRQISDAPDTDFAIQMTIQNKLASVPLSVFYKNKEDNKVLRFCFAKGKDTLEKAAEILSSI